MIGHSAFRNTIRRVIFRSPPHFPRSIHSSVHIPSTVLNDEQSISPSRLDTPLPGSSSSTYIDQQQHLPGDLNDDLGPDIDFDAIYDDIMSLPLEEEITSSKATPIKTSEPTLPRPEQLRRLLLNLSNSEYLNKDGRKKILDGLSSLGKAPTFESNSLVHSHSVENMKMDSVWIFLLRSAASDQDEDDLVEIIELMNRLKHDPSCSIGRALFSESSTSSPVFKDFLLEVARRCDISVQSATHHAEVHRLLHKPLQKPVEAYHAASDYVEGLERAAIPPCPTVYLQLFNFINHVSLRRSCSIELFNRMRLLAHPNPPLPIWNALLKALAAGASPDPERSMDLFLDLKTNGHRPTVETYNYLMRAMCRTRRAATGTAQRKVEYEKWYYGSLRLLNQMIHEDNLRPNLETFLVLLEGAKRAGDLARAKWSYGLFLRYLETSLQSPLVSGRDIYWTHVQAVTSLLQTYSSFVPSDKCLQTKKLEAVSHLEPTLADPTFFQTVPQATSDIRSEVRLIITQFYRKDHTLEFIYPPESRAEQRKLSFLIGAYLSVYSSHSTIDELYEQYKKYTVAFDKAIRYEPVRISWIYLILLERCEFVRSAKKAGMISREIFNEWQSNQENLEAFELVKSVESRLISQIWAAWIRLQAKYGGAEEAMKEMEKFQEKYPIKSLKDLETPFLVFRHLELVHHRFKQHEDPEKIKKLKRMVKGYENARRKIYDQLESKRLSSFQKMNTQIT